MAEWWSIEVFHGDGLRATSWKDSYADTFAEAALTNGAIEWEWHKHRTGVVFEICFGEPGKDAAEQWAAFRDLPVIRAALDAVPDPVAGLLIYRGRGGGAGSRKPRKPRPSPSAAAAELEEPAEHRFIDLTAS
jgi:hypothetical protein